MFPVLPHTEALSKVTTSGGIGLLSNLSKGEHFNKPMHSPGFLSGVVQEELEDENSNWPETRVKKIKWKNRTCINSFIFVRDIERTEAAFVVCGKKFSNNFFLLSHLLHYTN